MNVEENSKALGITEQEYQELLALFADVGMSDMKKLTTAMEEGDADLASRAAHSLKGAAGSLGLAEIYELSADVERLLRIGSLDEAADVIQLLGQRMNTLEAPA